MSGLVGKYGEFLREYRALCKKHGLMVFLDGEEVMIGDYDEELWGVEDSTVRRGYDDLPGEAIKP